MAVDVFVFRGPGDGNQDTVRLSVNSGMRDKARLRIYKWSIHNGNTVFVSCPNITHSTEILIDLPSLPSHISLNTR